MRIEILVGLENPVFYPINNSKTTIGSDLTCDIVVSEDQISRKHIVIHKEGDEFFVIDQGSTNGSYLNEERLIPGRRVEFTSYFPVRLGSSVLVSLVSDEEAQDEVNNLSIPFPGESSAPKANPLPPNPKPPREADEKTTVISLRDLQNSSTGSMVKQREAYKKKVAARAKEEARAPKKKKKKKLQKKRKFLQLYEIVALLIIGTALYLTYTGEDEQGPVAVTQTPTSGPEKTSESTPAPPAKVVAPNFVELFELKGAPKCQDPEEKLVCTSLGVDGADKWGAVKHNGQIVVLVDADDYYRHILKILPEPAEFDSSNEDDRNRFLKEVWELTVGWFLAKGFKTDDYLKLKDQELVFALFTSRQGIFSVRASFGIRPLKLSEVIRLTDEKRFAYVDVSRSMIVNYFPDFFQLNI